MSKVPKPGCGLESKCGTEIFFARFCVNFVHPLSDYICSLTEKNSAHCARLCVAVHPSHGNSNHFGTDMHNLHLAWCCFIANHTGTQKVRLITVPQ